MAAERGEKTNKNTRKVEIIFSRDKQNDKEKGRESLNKKIQMGSEF